MTDYTSSQPLALLTLIDGLLFVAGSLLIIWFSRRPLRFPGSHGFYRFFAWEAMLALLILNRRPWGEAPLSPHQLLSWPLLLLSIVLVASASLTFLASQQDRQRRDDGSLLEFEKTSQVISHGIFRYLRHPMYTSLLALTWGIFFQAPSWPGSFLALLATAFLILTALADERECLAFFGDAYADYMQRTRRFIPFLL